MITALAFGWVTALCWGAATIAAAPPTREGTPWMVLVWTNVIAAGVALTAALFTGMPDLDSSTIWYIVVAGVAFAGGLSLFLFAITGGQLSVVTPIVACDGALAALLAIGSGSTVSAIAAFGLAGIVVGVILIARFATADHASDARFPPPLTFSPPLVVALAIASAVMFGVTFFAAGKADTAGALWVVSLSRAIAAAVAILIVSLRRYELRCPPQSVPWLVASGLLDVAGYGAFVLGARHDLVVASVVASQYAAVGVLGAVALFGERVSKLQACGVVAVIAGTAVLISGYG